MVMAISKLQYNGRKETLPCVMVVEELTYREIKQELGEDPSLVDVKLCTPLLIHLLHKKSSSKSIITVI